jgi:steroid delta-isomerase-like uncharacterized protein
MAASAREVSKRHTELINAHDAKGLGALYAEDAVLTDPSGEYKGREAIVEYWAGFFQAFPDLNGGDTFTAESGDTVINEWNASGTNTGPLETPEGTVPATGKRMTLAGADAQTTRDGLIVNHRVYYDQLGWMTQLGLVPEGAAAG